MSSPYLLGHLQSSPEEDARLDRQHIYVRALMDKGNLLYPETKNAQVIGDIGCGTGVWLNDVARTYGCERLVGWDVNSERFVKLKEKGVEFSVWDGTTDVPNEFEGKFDVINIRVLWLAITTEKWKILIQNALKLLKPGGYLQWLEGEFKNLVISPPSPDFDRTIELMSLERQKRKLAEYVPMFMLQTLIDMGIEVLYFEQMQMGDEEIFRKLEESGQGTRQEFTGIVFTAVKFILQNMMQDNDEHNKLLQFFETAEREPGKWKFDARFPKLLARKAI